MSCQEDGIGGGYQEGVLGCVANFFLNIFVIVR